MATKINIKDRVKQGQGASVFFEEENPESSNNNESEIVIESKTVSESITESTSVINPNRNPISNPKYEKVKYTDSRTQRAFYYDKHSIKIFDKEYPKNKFDKSKIMNDLLRKFLEENGKI